MKRIIPLLVAAGLAVIALSGCANASASPTPTATSARDSAVAFAECMRENGVDMPDPDADGRIRIDPDSDVDEAEMQNAQEACSNLLGSGPSDSSGGLGAAEKQRMLDLAACIRENGFPDFPDPEFGDGGQVMLGGEGIDPGDPAFQATAKTCEEEVGFPAPGGGK